MAFDLATAKPITGGFDLSTAKPDDDQQPVPALKDDRSFMDKAIGVGETALTIGSSIVADPIAGYAGLVSSPFTATSQTEDAGDVVRRTREALTYQPRTEAGQEYIQDVGEKLQPVGEFVEKVERYTGDIGESAGGPTGGAIGSMVPTAAAELLGIGIGKGVSKIPQTLSKRSISKADDLRSQADDILAPRATDAGLEDAAQVIQKGKPEDVAKMVNPDADYYKAADELGINTEPLASFASQNPQYRSLEMGLSSIPASQLDNQAKAFIAEVGQKADDIITEYGGTLDKAELSGRFREDSLKTIDDIYDREGLLYDSIENVLPKTTRVDASNTLSYINKRAKELGGPQNLPPQLKKLLRELSPKTKKGNEYIDLSVGKKTEKLTVNPTHELLNQRRKEAGQQLGRKGNTLFKDMETGELKSLYAAMKKDQELIASKTDGLGDVVESANALTIQRKQIEDNLTTLLGKQMQDDLMPKVGQAIKGLQKGRVEKWEATINAIPENMRKEVVVSALNDIFRGNGASQQQFNPTQFVKFMNELDRQPKMKAALYKELPPESIRAVENLTKVSNGISIALGDKIPTGRIAAFFDENNGFLRRMMGKSVTIAASLKAGPIVGAVVNEFLSQSSDGSRAAANIMASNQFQKIIRQAVTDGVSDGNRASSKLLEMEKNLRKARVYDDWAKTLSESDLLKLNNVGIVNYLFNEGEE